MPSNGLNLSADWRGRLGFLRAVLEDSLPVIAALAALLCYAILGAELNPREARLVALGAQVITCTRILQHVLGMLTDGVARPSYLARHRYGGALTALSPILLIASAPLITLWQLLVLADVIASFAATSLEFLARYLKIPAPLLIVLSFALVIVVGAAFLLSPHATPPGKPISALDALFTATSATCVTGLTVRDTGTEFTHFGRVVIVVLIQVGGLGIMTFASFFSLLLGSGLGIKEGLVLRDVLNVENLSRARPLLVFILEATFAIEIAGAVALYFALGPYWRPELGLGDRAFAALFHSVSAFCNAGFSSFPRELVVPGANLEAFRGNIAVLSIISMLIILGGLGFPVLLNISDRLDRLGLYEPTRRILRRLRLLLAQNAPRPFRSIGHRARGHRGPDSESGRRYRRDVHSSIVGVSTVVLLIGGAIAVGVFERGGELFKRLTTTEAIATATFQSVTARTAGFNSVLLQNFVAFECACGHKDSVPVGGTLPDWPLRCPRAGCRQVQLIRPEQFSPGLSEASLALTIFLMFIGASPGSTGGGVKTVTVALLLLAILTRFRRREAVEVSRRTLPRSLVQDSAVIILLLFFVASAVALTLAWSERGLHPGGGDWRFIDLLFESVSGLATVGLSTGVTPWLSNIGRVAIIIAMFIGRIGPLTLVLSLSTSSIATHSYSYPQTTVMIG